MKSQNGWKASKNQVLIGIKQFTVPGTDRKFRLQKHAGKILVQVAKEFHERVEPIDEGTFDDWGYAYREVRFGNGDLSNHASGTAIDLNATKHPLGKMNTFTKPQQKIIREICSKYGVRWGGDFKRPDDMHFEIIETPKQVKARIKDMGL